MRRYSASVRLDRPVEGAWGNALGSMPKHWRAMMFKRSASTFMVERLWRDLRR